MRRRLAVCAALRIAAHAADATATLLAPSIISSRATVYGTTPAALLAVRDDVAPVIAVLDQADAAVIERLLRALEQDG